MFSSSDRDEVWTPVVHAVPRDLIEQWIRELHGSKVHSVRWIDDVEILPFVSFMDGTHCCGISLCDPPDWLVLKMCRYAWQKPEKETE